MFHILKTNEDEIQVMHADGHRYTFLISESEPGGRVLVEGQLVQDSHGADDALDLRHYARRFAEVEARKANLID